MSIASEIARLQSDSTAIANAIAAKGVTVPAGSGYDDYAALITSIPSGSSGLPAWLKDGDTHLWIDIMYPDQLEQAVCIRMIGTINWGDGTTENVSVTTYTVFSHTYSSVGKYRIDLHPTSGTFYLGRANGSYNVMGYRYRRYDKVFTLYQVEVGSSRITTLSAYCFYYCRGLLRLYIPDNITTINGYAFTGCSALFQIETEDATKLTSVSGNQLFYLCYRLCHTGGLIPNTASWTYTFRDCSSLYEMTIPSNVTSLNTYCLYNTATLKHMYCYPTTPPTAATDKTLSNISSSCVIHVPTASLSAYQSATYWSDLASQMVGM